MPTLDPASPISTTFATRPLVFRWLSLAGALYLIWLAAEALLVRHDASRKPNLSRSRRPILDGLMIVFANPSVLLFYAVFLPQFIDPDHSILEQMLVLSALYVCTALAFDSACVLTVARLRLPAGWSTRIGRFAELGSAVAYLVIATITVVGFFEASG
jgi:homoserine/homoserine lactone efflux protein